MVLIKENHFIAAQKIQIQNATFFNGQWTATITILVKRVIVAIGMVTLVTVGLAQRNVKGILKKLITIQLHQREDGSAAFVGKKV